MEFPILDELCALAGWSKNAPYFQGAVLRHPEAEALIGRPIVIMPVRMLDPRHLERCSQELPTEEGGWCLAISPLACLSKMPVTIGAQGAA